MDSVNTIEEVYAVIDQPFWYPGKGSANKVIALFQEFGKLQHKLGNDQLVHIAQLEIDLQHFHIRKNELRPSMTGTRENGEPFEHPSLKNITAEGYAYLSRRVEQTRNAWLIVRYAHFLWLSPHKKIVFANKALEQYKLLLSQQKEALPGRSFSNILFNAFCLSQSLKNTESLEALKKILFELIHSSDTNAEIKGLQIAGVQFMLEQSKIFKPRDFNGVQEVCLSLAESYEGLSTKITMYQWGEKVAQKTKNRSADWASLTAAAYEQLSIQREDGMNLVAMDFCQKAIQFFKKARNKTKIAELQSRYKKLKQESSLAPFVQELDLTNKYKLAKAIASDVLKKSPAEILMFLTYSEILIPSYQYLYDHAVEMHENSFSQYMLTTAVKDEHGHTSAYYTEQAEKLHHTVMLELDLALRTASFLLLQEIFVGAVVKNKLSAWDVFTFFKDCTWIGQPVSIKYKEGKTEQYNWLETIMPAINDLIGQLFFSYQQPGNPPNYVLVIDSLSVKMEGVIRDFCELRGVNTFFHVEDKNENNIAKEKDLNALLHEEVVQQTLSKDDLMLLRFLFVDKTGWNLRNRVAHALMRKEAGYTLAHSLFLFVAFLRIGKAEYAVA